MKIDNVELVGQLVPASTIVTHKDVTKSEVVDATGTTHRYYLKTKVSISCVWHITNERDAKELITMTKKPILKIYYKNPETSTFQTIDAYRGNVESTVYSENSNLPYYKEIKMEFHEF